MKFLQYLPLITLFLVLMLFACETKQKCEAPKLRVIKIKEDMEVLLQRQEYSNFTINELKKDGYSYAILEIDNCTDSTIYFQTCDSIIDFHSSFKAFRMIENEKFEVKSVYKFPLYREVVSSKLKFSYIPPHKKNNFYFLFKKSKSLLPDFDEELKIHEIVTHFQYTHQPKEIIGKDPRIPHDLKKVIGILFTFDDESNIQISQTQVYDGFRVP